MKKSCRDMEYFFRSNNFFAAKPYNHQAATAAKSKKLSPTSKKLLDKPASSGAR